MVPVSGRFNFSASQPSLYVSHSTTPQPYSCGMMARLAVGFSDQKASTCSTVRSWPGPASRFFDQPLTIGILVRGRQGITGPFNTCTRAAAHIGYSPCGPVLSTFCRLVTPNAVSVLQSFLPLF